MTSVDSGLSPFFVFFKYEITSATYVTYALHFITDSGSNKYARIGQEGDLCLTYAICRKNKKSHRETCDPLSLNN